MSDPQAAVNWLWQSGAPHETLEPGNRKALRDMATESTLKLNTLSAIATLLAFVVVVLAIGIFIGMQTAPGEWYRALEKPPFNPPNWIFGPVWTVLYVFIAVAGWRTFRQAPGSVAVKLWVAQMVLNWTWSPVFFAFHQLWFALVILLGMLAAILFFIVDRWQLDRTAALLFCPYAAWVGFAGILNLSLALLN
ncbi:TspO/MBR family protein [Roseibium sp. MMSF_3412]|uniref:TspO/MBR family protein n=1 Tax=Roseibium sp. MMSF_3412 TaxID=3046712 RepID=UPI00273F4300|nr:TspO/MBR family protein [Roseibium sp. MMSF_3412]